MIDPATKSIQFDASESPDRLGQVYSLAITSAQYEGNLIWLIFSALTVANSVLLTFIGMQWAQITSDWFLFLVLVGVSVIGVVLNNRWYRSIRRQFKFYEYWWNWAKEAELQMFGGANGMILSLGPWVSGQMPNLDLYNHWKADESFDRESKRWQLSYEERSSPNRAFAQSVPLMFGVLFAVILAFQGYIGIAALCRA